MPRYDATTKHLVESAPLDWVQLAGFRDVNSAQIVDADLSTITAQADKIIQIDDAHPWLMHIEFQSSDDTNTGMRLCRYNVLVEYRHQLPVQSVLVLLTPDADGPAATGVLKRCLPNGSCYDVFQYAVVRVWQLPIESVLSGGLGILPLAPLTSVPEGQISDIIDKIRLRIDQEVAGAVDRREFWEATAILMGMRLPFDQIQALMKGITNMRESSVIQHYLKEGLEQGLEQGLETGRIVGVRDTLKKLATRHFQVEATSDQLDRLNAISNMDVLAEMLDQIHNLESWDDLVRLGERLQSD